MCRWVGNRKRKGGTEGRRGQSSHHNGTPPYWSKCIIFCSCIAFWSTESQCIRKLVKLLFDSETNRAVELRLGFESSLNVATLCNYGPSPDLIDKHVHQQQIWSFFFTKDRLRRKLGPNSQNVTAAPF